jgi:hypothetical protein
LSAFYALRDCERLVQESLERLDLGAGIGLPLAHCVFALRDVGAVLAGSHLEPRPFEDIGEQASSLADELDAAARSSPGSDTHHQLIYELSIIRSLREAVATTPELP